jgi:hypothetical protein
MFIWARSSKNGRFYAAVIIGPGSSSTISPQNLEELVKEINKAKAKKRRNQ